MEYIQFVCYLTFFVGIIFFAGAIAMLVATIKYGFDFYVVFVVLVLFTSGSIFFGSRIKYSVFKRDNVYGYSDSYRRR